MSLQNCGNTNALIIFSRLVWVEWSVVMLENVIKITNRHTSVSVSDLWEPQYLQSQIVAQYYLFADHSQPWWVAKCTDTTWKLRSNIHRYWSELGWWYSIVPILFIFTAACLTNVLISYRLPTERVGVTDYKRVHSNNAESSNELRDLLTTQTHASEVHTSVVIERPPTSDVYASVVTVWPPAVLHKLLARGYQRGKWRKPWMKYVSNLISICPINPIPALNLNGFFKISCVFFKRSFWHNWKSNVGTGATRQGQEVF